MWNARRKLCFVAKVNEGGRMWSAVNFANWGFLLNRGPEHTCPNHLERYMMMCDITQYSFSRSSIVGLVRVLKGRFELFFMVGPQCTNIIFIFLQ